jgi:hypothetical protein
MTVSNILGTRVVLGRPDALPTPDNENLPLRPDWMTPAELMQWIQREKVRLSREVALNPQLWVCPKHRRDWLLTLGIEKLTLWQCYGVRGG